MHTAIVDSRRLMGPNLYSRRHGAVLEIMVDAKHTELVRARWRGFARTLLDELGWHTEGIVTRAWPGGLGLFVTAPIDGLLAATELTELALSLAEDPAATPHVIPDDLRARLRVHMEHERLPTLAALVAEAERRALIVTFDDDQVAVGAGHGARHWPLHAVPPLHDIDWSGVHNVPVALVTGSNGKTTTTRLVAAMLNASGFVSGHTCTDGVIVAGEQAESGDWSGPAGARRVLQDPRVGAAVLETARGGILRRGVALARATVAVVTRIAADHLGEYGIHDEYSLGEAKLAVARARAAGAPVVLNADDPLLAALSATVEPPIVWFALTADHLWLQQHLAQGGRLVTTVNGRLVIRDGQRTHDVGLLADIPITLGGIAQHNVANVLAATAAAAALGCDIAAIERALHAFGRSALDNPGRLQVRQVHGATVIVDFVHNPDGWTAMLDLAARMRTPESSLLVTLGQAGDRSDADLDAMARVVWSARPALIVLKEMDDYLRGRPYGQTTEVLAEALRRAGAPDDHLAMAPSELDAARLALTRARAGDVLIVATHASYHDVMAMVEAADVAWHDRRPHAADSSSTTPDAPPARVVVTDPSA